MKLKLRKIRLKKGFTQKKLAAKLGLDRSMISRYENGETPLTVDTIYRLTRILKVSVSDLLPDR